jgi:hypothetical protein
MLELEVKVGFSYRNPAGGGVAFSRRIDPRGQHLKIHTLIGRGLRKAFTQKWHKGLHLIRTEYLLRRHFFSEPSERQSLFLTERKSAHYGSEFVGGKVDRMGVGHRVRVPLQ